MELINYNDLVTRYGKRMAYVALTIIESSARITKDTVVQLDCEKRLRCAFDAMRDQRLAA